MTLDKTQKDRIAWHFLTYLKSGHSVGVGGICGILDLSPCVVKDYRETVRAVARQVPMLEYATPEDISYPLLCPKEEYR